MFHTNSTVVNKTSPDCLVCTMLGDDYLVWNFNEREYQSRKPCIYYSLCLMILGVLGNGITFYIYYYKLPRTSANMFILFLAVYDIIACTFGIPFEVVDMRLPLFSGKYVYPCKILRYIEFTANYLSCLTLMCVAIDRHKKVCNPLSHFGVERAKLALRVCIVLALFTSWPCLIVFGSREIITDIPGIYGHDCAVDDALRNTIYPLVFYFIFLLGNLTSYFILIGVYIHIGIAIFNWKRTTLIGSSNTSRKSSKGSTGTDSDNGGISAISYLPSNPSETISARCNSEGDIHSLDGIEKTPNTSNKKKWTTSNAGSSSSSYSASRRHARLGRTTAIFVCVTVVYIISYMPYLVVENLQLAGLLKPEEMSFTLQEVIYIFDRSYFINNAVNPIIYSTMNPTFRKEFLSLFTGN